MSSRGSIAASGGDQARGLIMAGTGAALWGLSGTAAQVLFAQHAISPQWLVTMRMLGAGVILLIWLRPSFPRRDALHLALFGILGLAAVQYTYLAAIAYSNVATATCIQYLSIPMIALYELLVARKRLKPITGLLIVLALGGTTLLVLAGPNGSLSLRITPVGLVLALLSAVTAAYYALASIPLIGRYGAWKTATWGFVLGGLFMALWAPPWSAHPVGSSLEVASLTVFVVLFGSLMAFGLFLASLAHIPATLAAIAVTVEPLTAALASYFFLGNALYPLQYVGGALILLAVTLLRTIGNR